ncbi:hypothetical protein MVES1_003660 [Malassezia vespertilionis]|uniref:uncharacterized protein n=1 Tax=Malassezia vespertilionis TaxID=2020962 RepID=UPI0024B0D157|nr:uncharacterized protein MVES1_003660 [Malassezia vespertilionis]WFD08288.1 hypothetical protein MVES1_003660 [Malassezia vespertilionis]
MHGDEYDTHAWTQKGATSQMVTEDPAGAWVLDSDDESNETDSLGDDWDMYRDFNNMGQGPSAEPEHGMHARKVGDVPRYSERSSKTHLVSVQPLLEQEKDFTRAYSFGSDDDTKLLRRGPMHEPMIELEDLPPLGTEFSSYERERMTRRSRRTRKRLGRLGYLDSWLRGYTPLCGWFGPRAAVAIGFVLVVVIGVTLFFVIPRVPSVTLVTKDPLVPAQARSDMAVTVQPTGFTMNGTLALHMDNSQGWIPSHLKTVEAVVKFQPQDTKVGEGKLKGPWIPGRTSTRLHVPISFSYKSPNATGDDTQLTFQDACAHLSLDLSVKVTLDVAGIAGTHTSLLDLPSFACPWELPN